MALVDWVLIRRVDIEEELARPVARQVLDHAVDSYGESACAPWSVDGVKRSSPSSSSRDFSATGEPSLHNADRALGGAQIPEAGRNNRGKAISRRFWPRHAPELSRRLLCEAHR